MSQSPNGMRSRRTRELMFPVIASWESSGLTQESFCKHQGLSIGTFSYWLKKYRTAYQEDSSSQETASSFIPITVNSTESSAIAFPVLEVAIGSVQLRFHQLPSADWLSELIG